VGGGRVDACAYVFPGALLCACACARAALLIQHARRMRRIVFSSVAFLVPPNFSTLAHKRHYFRAGEKSY
jgi:hypothetical protein